MDLAGADLAGAVARGMPRLRRYARALTGSQAAGDAFAAATLEAIVSGGALLLLAEASGGGASVGGISSGGISDGRTSDGRASDGRAKVALFQAFHVVWASAREPPVGGAPDHVPDGGPSARPQGHLARLTANSREALLLHAIEGFSEVEIGAIMGVSAAKAAALVDAAIREMEEQVSGRVLVIEDEAVIAMDIRAVVEAMGHRVTGVARTRAEAVGLAAGTRPDLILADVRLADDSSGIDAVADILALIDAVPVIFVTAFPERLLTGLRPEPAFLIGKPFSEEQLRSAVSQAMAFAPSRTLAA